MTGPMYDNERMQELAEDNGYLKSKLRAAETTAADLAVKMEWSPAMWDRELTGMKKLYEFECSARRRIQRELDETKAALEDALHDAKRWRAIAGAPE